MSFGLRHPRCVCNIKVQCKEVKNTTRLLSVNSVVNKTTCFGLLGGHHQVQTGRSFATCFREHKNAFRTASHSSNFAKHLIEHAHSFGPIHNTMQILQLQLVLFLTSLHCTFTCVVSPVYSRLRNRTGEDYFMLNYSHN